MPNVALRWLLFLSSYVPVFALLGLRALDRSCAIFILCCVALVLALAGIAVFALELSRTKPALVTVHDVQSRDADLAGYLVGYLLPFVAAEASDWQDVVALALVLLLIGVVYVNSRMIYVNPLLAVLGYRLAAVRASADPEADPESLGTQVLVCRHAQLRESPLSVRQLGTELLFAGRAK